jgi:hypothetical protein
VSSTQRTAKRPAGSAAKRPPKRPASAASLLWRFAFVATFAWALAMGALVPGMLFYLAYGKFQGFVVAIIGGAIGFFVHRFAWGGDSAPHLSR